MIVRAWLIAGIFLIAAAWYLAIFQVPPEAQASAPSNIEAYRDAGLMPAASALVMSSRIGHDIFETPASDAEHLARTEANGADPVAGHTMPGMAMDEGAEHAEPGMVMEAEAEHGGGGHAGGGGIELISAAGARTIDRTVSVEMMEWGYRPGSITVNSGEVVRLEVTHAGNIPHEFMIMTGPEMAAVMYRSGRADWNLVEHQAIYEKPLVMPGDRFEVTLRIAQPGTWMFMCMFPYHMQMGMMGAMATEGMSSMDMGGMKM